MYELASNKPSSDYFKNGCRIGRAVKPPFTGGQKTLFFKPCSHEALGGCVLNLFVSMLFNLPGSQSQSPSLNV